MTGAYAGALLAQVPVPSALTAISQGGAAVAVIVVVGMVFRRDAQREARDQARDARMIDAIEGLADRFEAKLKAIDDRHYDAEREGRAAMVDLMNRNLVVTKELAENLVGIKFTLQANVETTRENTTALRRLEQQRRDYHDNTPDPDR